MGTYTGTSANELIRPDVISASVTSSPPGSKPGSGADIVYGGGGSDHISGAGGGDFLYGGSGDDTVKGGDDDDNLYGGTGADDMYGGVGNDTYYADHPGDYAAEYLGDGTFLGIDLVYSSVSFTLWRDVENLQLTGKADINGTGNSGDNSLVGNIGDNVLKGYGGSDTIQGGRGADSLYGGSGADVFEFVIAKHSAPGASSQDIIKRTKGEAFEGAGDSFGDRIDVSEIDADAAGTSGDQAFQFGKATGTGRLWVIRDGSDTVILGNTDRDAAPELSIRIQDGSVSVSAYSSFDFIL